MKNTFLKGDLLYMGKDHLLTNYIDELYAVVTELYKHNRREQYHIVYCDKHCNRLPVMFNDGILIYDAEDLKDYEVVGNNKTIILSKER